MKKSTNFYFKWLLIFVIQTLFVLKINAQKSNQELMKLIENKNTTKSQKFQYLYDLSLNYFQIDSAKAYNYSNQVLKIGQELGSEIKQVIALENLSRLASRYDDLPNQIKYADQCFLLAKKINDEQAMAYGNYAIALKYEIIDNQEKYISYMLKALNYFEKTKTRYDKLINGYENLAGHFGNINNNEVQKKYAKKALDLSLESKNAIDIASTLTSWALYLVDDSKKQKPINFKLLDSASNCYLKAIKIFESNNEQLNYSYGRTCLNLTSLYLYNFFETRQKKTLEYLKKTQEVCLKINNPHQLMVMYGQQAEFYNNLNDIQNLEKVLVKIEEFMNKQKNVQPRYRMLLAENYMDLATLKNDFPSYRKHFDLFDKANADMIDKENRSREFNATIRFETEQKNQKIKLLSETLQDKKKINYLYGTLFVLTLISLLFMFSTYNFRQKAYIKENLLLQKANEEANLLSKLKEEEAMNAMLESELYEKELQIAIQEKILTEQQKDKLQQELMTNNLQLDRKNEILKEIKEKLSFLKSEKTSEIKSISKSINKNIEIDDEFELLKTNLENTNPVFFTTLQQQAKNVLTKLDFKYCGYIRLGMSTKEIANHMNIETQSMRMARYRIKQKLNLDKEQDLDSYIRNI